MHPADVVNLLLDDQQPYEKKERALRHHACATTAVQAINNMYDALPSLTATIPATDARRHAALAFVITEIVYLQHRPREKNEYSKEPRLNSTQEARHPT
jgi:hypothetical protein